ncbi:uncharacterized protein TNIN_201022 [Trichonephila inaurata madagascariensis]|uniref:Uncharacterized protein n=1 Tax=Trichonephila inaurata madagascariensis TaxID=2747483 RepID=A0A8X6IK67_9ARAC|nr:uncharacterized protein TNIN_201022 [Trichonephila inaurata madagascariensis]
MILCHKSPLSFSGKPKEEGHYGLWTLCTTKGPHWTEDCDPLDTFFQAPSYLIISGILGIGHLLILLSLLLLESFWIILIRYNERGLWIKSRTLSITKVSLAFISVFIAVLIVVFVSVGETRQEKYFVEKGWSFWIQILVIVSSLGIALVNGMERRQDLDPEGTRAETYGNPTFNPDSPEVSRHGVAYTEASGYPYELKNGQVTLMYENSSYQEHSPGVRRLHAMY